MLVDVAHPEVHIDGARNRPEHVRFTLQHLQRVEPAAVGLVQLPEAMNRFARLWIQPQGLLQCGLRFVVLRQLLAVHVGECKVDFNLLIDVIDDLDVSTIRLRQSRPILVVPPDALESAHGRKVPPVDMQHADQRLRRRRSIFEVRLLDLRNLRQRVDLKDVVLSQRDLLLVHVEQVREPVRLRVQVLECLERPDVGRVELQDFAVS